VTGITLCKVIPDPTGQFLARLPERTLVPSLVETAVPTGAAEKDLVRVRQHATGLERPAPVAARTTFAALRSHLAGLLYNAGPPPRLRHARFPFATPVNVALERMEKSDLPQELRVSLQKRVQKDVAAFV
jgi:hypothetical protein